MKRTLVPLDSQNDCFTGGFQPLDDMNRVSMAAPTARGLGYEVADACGDKATSFGDTLSTATQVRTGFLSPLAMSDAAMI